MMKNYLIDTILIMFGIYFDVKKFRTSAHVEYNRVSY